MARRRERICRRGSRSEGKIALRENKSEPSAGRGDRAKPDPTMAAAPASSAWGVLGGDSFLFQGNQREGEAGPRSPKTRQARGTGADGANGTVTPPASRGAHIQVARDVTASAMVVLVGEASLMEFKPKAGKGRTRPRLAA